MLLFVSCYPQRKQFQDMRQRSVDYYTSVPLIIDYYILLSITIEVNNRSNSNQSSHKCTYVFT
jgi:hypothetical protein